MAESYFSSEVNNKKFDDFRSKKLLSFKEHVTRIQVRGKAKFTVQWADNKWSLGEAKPFPLDDNRLDDFWSDIKNLEAKAIKEAVTPSVLRKYNLHKAQLKILFYDSSNKEYTLSLSPFQKDKAFVVVSGRDYIFEMSKDKAEKLILSKNQIRDHDFPFNSDTSSVTQIERKSTSKSFSIKKIRTNQWRVFEEESSSAKDFKKSIDQQTKDVPIDPKKVDALLDKIKKLKGEKYKARAKSQNNRSLVMKK